MKNAEFVALMISNTNKTRNLRTYGKRWFSGARRIGDKVATKIGKMVALMQYRIDCGEIINGNEQCLLVYNFQPLYCDTNAAYLTFDMLIKPIEEIHDTHSLNGIPLQIVVDAVTCDMMNNARAMLQMGLQDDVDEIEEEVEGKGKEKGEGGGQDEGEQKQQQHHDGAEDMQSDPVYYGNYCEFNAICSFLTVSNPTDLEADDIFKGKYDDHPIIQNGMVFDSFVEARDYLESHWSEYNMVAELNYPKEDHPRILKSLKIGCHMIKLIHPHKPRVEVSNRLSTFPKEDRVDDEVCRLLDANSEAPAEADFVM